MTPQGGLFFQLVRGTVKGPEVISFLKAVRREVGGPVIILWDNLRTHGSVLVKQRVEEHPDVRLEYLPPCAPDLNPDEGVWQWLKDEPLGNFCARDLEGIGRADSGGEAQAETSPGHHSRLLPSV